MMDSYNIFSDISEIKKRLDKLEGKILKELVRKIYIKGYNISLKNDSFRTIRDIPLSHSISVADQVYLIGELNKYSYYDDIIINIDGGEPIQRYLVIIVNIMASRGYNKIKCNNDSISCIQLSQESLI